MFGTGERWLLCKTRSRCFALPVGAALEIMRALPTERVATAPPFVLGVSIIRGIPVPVVDTAALLGEPMSDAKRFSTVRARSRILAFAIESVIGLHTIPKAVQEKLPALFGNNDAIAAIAALDEGITYFLNAARAVSEDFLAALDDLESGA